jgi:tRNA(Leu) C34 or U34 (ribose-2'-O)-methylase TrmL
MERGYAAIGLVQPKTPANVGSVLRAAGCYGAAMVATTGKRYTKAPTDVGAQYRHMPLLNVADLREVIPHACVPVAVDLVCGAKSLVHYTHPESAFYVFGPEDGTLGPSTLDWCRDVIYVPTERCMNLAACVNVILYDRMAKRHSTALSLVRNKRSA